MKFLMFVSLPGLMGAAPILFDVTEASGLDGELYNSPTRHSLGVVWFDANNDGYPDIFATNGYNVDLGRALQPHLYLNNRDGTFVLSDHLLPELPNYEYTGALAADYDCDGDTDLFVYTGNERFSIHGTEDNPIDGPPNLLLKNYFVEKGGDFSQPLFGDVAQEAGLNYCPPELTENFALDARYDSYQTWSATFLDYNLDGRIDLYVGHMVMNRAASLDPTLDEIGKVANQDILYENQGDGTFAVQHNALQAGHATARCALVTVSGHLNKDIWPDIYVGNVGHEPIQMSEGDHRDVILLNDGLGNFIPGFPHLGGDSPAAMGIDFADVNFDGQFDIYVTDTSHHPLDINRPESVGNTFYLSGKSGFKPNSAVRHGVAFLLSWGTNIIDFDLDGRPEIFVGSGRVAYPSTLFYKQKRQPLQNYHLQTFNVRGSAVADYDRDGDPDLLVVNVGAGLQLFRNEAQIGGNQAIVVEVNPSQSNPDGIGVRATLTTTDGHRMIRQIKGGTSFHSQDFSREIYFGIRDQGVAKLEIEWPHFSEKRQIFENPIVEANGRIVVSEPE